MPILADMAGHGIDTMLALTRMPAGSLLTVSGEVIGKRWSQNESQIRPE
jgi:hypothetical protein